MGGSEGRRVRRTWERQVTLDLGGRCRVRVLTVDSLARIRLYKEINSLYRAVRPMSEIHLCIHGLV